jgi:GT2 family glycosyltransferase
MTSVLTTGGIRGKKQAVGKFQPRSFNLGLSKAAFKKTQGFTKMKNGEDIDLTFRLWQNGFETQLLEKAFVYHKRRSSLKQFFNQTFGFGTARPILSKKYPETAKLTYWFPSLFIIGLDVSIISTIFGYQQLLYFYEFYFVLIFFDALFRYKNIQVALLSIAASLTQFLGYGLGFLQSRFFSPSKK